MKAYATVIPIKNDVTADEVVKLAINWFKTAHPDNEEAQLFNIPQSGLKHEQNRSCFEYYQTTDSVDGKCISLRFTIQEKREKQVTEIVFKEIGEKKLLRLDVYSVLSKTANRSKNGVLSYLFENNLMLSDSVKALIEKTGESDEIEPPKFAEVRMRERDEHTRLQIRKAEEKIENNYINTFENEVKDKNIEIDDLNRKVKELLDENYKLKSKCASFNSALAQEKSLEHSLINMADITEFFDGEQYDLIISALKLYEKNAEQNTRAKELVKSILEKNPLHGQGKKIFDELLRIFTASPEINKSAESELRELGFSMRRDKAGHNQLEYNNNSNYRFTATCSPGDRNAGCNRMQEIRRRLSIYKD